MTNIEFNEKYKKHLVEGFQGLVIFSKRVVNYLDKEFEKEIKQNKEFKYMQIKFKFGNTIVYTLNKTKSKEWKLKIDSILLDEYNQVREFNKLT